MDTLGHLLALHVTPANEGDRAAVGVLAEAVQDATGESVTLAYVAAFAMLMLQRAAALMTVRNSL